MTWKLFFINSYTISAKRIYFFRYWPKNWERSVNVSLKPWYAMRSIASAVFCEEFSVRNLSINFSVPVPESIVMRTATVRVLDSLYRLGKQGAAGNIPAAYNSFSCSFNALTTLIRTHITAHNALLENIKRLLRRLFQSEVTVRKTCSCGIDFKMHTSRFLHPLMVGPHSKKLDFVLGVTSRQKQHCFIFRSQGFQYNFFEKSREICECRSSNDDCNAFSTWHSAEIKWLTACSFVMPIRSRNLLRTLLLHRFFLSHISSKLSPFSPARKPSIHHFIKRHVRITQSNSIALFEAGIVCFRNLSLAFDLSSHHVHGCLCYSALALRAVGKTRKRRDIELVERV